MPRSHHQWQSLALRALTSQSGVLSTPFTDSFIHSSNLQVICWGSGDAQGAGKSVRRVGKLL